MARGASLFTHQTVIPRKFTLMPDQSSRANKGMRPSSVPPFLPQQLIIKKRNGQTLSQDEWTYFLQGFIAGRIPDYQMSAMLMAVYFKGMSRQETTYLVNLSKDSGRVLDWGQDKQFTIDKHSTGGVGDKTSLVILPLCVLQGVRVPMIAGRGLGHTGGTVDKLAAVGWNTKLAPDAFQDMVRKHGGSLIGQTEDLAPMDRSLYALRDVTGTVESIPLIVGSILSKKLAEGISGLVMDIKYGSGAFMTAMDQVFALADELNQVAAEAGLRMHGVISSMEEPLGEWSGNALEIYEVLQILAGKGPADTLELSLELAAQMVLLAYPNRGPVSSIKDNILKSISSGQALETFLRLASAHGSDLSLLENPERLLQAPYVHTMVWPKTHQKGTIAAIDTKALGFNLIHLGAGRSKVADGINPWVGLKHTKKIGDQIDVGEPFGQIYGKSQQECLKMEASIIPCYHIVDPSQSVVKPPLILKSGL